LPGPAAWAAAAACKETAVDAPEPGPAAAVYPAPLKPI